MSIHVSPCQSIDSMHVCPRQYSKGLEIAKFRTCETVQREDVEREDKACMKLKQRNTCNY